MRRLAFVMICLLSLAIRAQTSAEKQAIIVVKGPTIVAFSPPVTDQQIEKDPGTNEALSDFQFYASEVREPLRKAAVDFQELYVNWFKVRIGSKVTIFRPGKVDVGYYFVAPGKKPRIEYGVMTNLDLFRVAHEYFGIPLID